MHNRLDELLAAMSAEAAQRQNAPADLIILDLKNEDLQIRSNAISREMNNKVLLHSVHPREALAQCTDEELEVMHLWVIFKLPEYALMRNLQDILMLTAALRVQNEIHDIEEARGLQSKIDPLPDDSGMRVTYNKRTPSA